MGKQNQWAGWTEQRVKDLVSAGKVVSYRVIAKRATNVQPGENQARKGNQKHGNTLCEYNGIKFDSIKERKRYIELEFLQLQGIIRNLRLQVEYELNEDGKFSYKYVADFVYVVADTGMEIVEDCKGFRTREYKKKKKLMQKIHGIVIKET